MNLSPFSVQEEALFPGNLIAMKSLLANSSEIQCNTECLKGFPFFFLMCHSRPMIDLTACYLPRCYQYKAYFTQSLLLPRAGQ